MAIKEELLRPEFTGARLREEVVFLAVRLRGAAIIYRISILKLHLLRCADAE